MDKQTILEQLDIHHAEFRHLIGSLRETDYLAAPIANGTPGSNSTIFAEVLGQ